MKPTKINKLILDGFKSFGRRTELLFGNDFNIIIGPNGSGKSNVLDALCFVLGKSSSKSLRAEKSANLIYNGGKSKQPGKSAEVSIVFDNSDTTFPVEEKEVKVSRIVRKDGTSKYKINQKSCTRQEVVELLNNAKIDPDGYNIIMQGDIVSLVEMSPVDRRGIIEDIAGIGVYEEKKQKALNELGRVDEKLGECEIILKERSQSLKELKKDRDQALRYKQLSDNVKKNKASFLKRKLDKKESSREGLLSKLEKQKEKLSAAQEQIRLLREDIGERRQKVKQLSRDIEEKGSAEQVQLNKSIESLRIAIATKKTRSDHLRTEVHRINQRKEQLSQNLSDIEERGANVQEELESVKSRASGVEEQLKDLNARLDSFRRKQGLDKEQDLQKGIEDLDQRSEEMQSRIHKLQEECQQALRDKDKIEFQLQTIDQAIEKMADLEKQHKSELESLKNSKAEFKKVVVELNGLLNSDSKDAASVSRVRQELQRRNEELAKLNVKQAGYREHMSANIAVHKVLENKQKFGGVYGTVSELATVSEKYSLALEVAAAQRINSVVVEDDKVAHKCIDFLKSNRFGVATFLPINSLKPVNITSEMRALAKTSGAVGFAIELVDFDPKFRHVFSYVFGSTLVVKDLAAARKIGIGKIRMVTLEGDLCEFSGAMVGGFRHKKTGSFKEKELVSRLESVNSDIARLEAEMSQLESRRKESDDRIVRLRELKAELEGNIIKQEKALHLDTGDLQANKDYKEDLVKQLELRSEEVRELESQISEATSELTGLKIERQKLRSDFTALRSPTVLAELNAFEQKRTEMIEQRARLESEQKRLELQLADLVGRDKDNTQKVVKELDKERQSFQKELEELDSELRTAESDLKVHEKNQEEFLSKHKELFQQRNQLSDEITAFEQDLFKKEEESRKEELQINTMDLQYSQLRAETAALKEEFAQYEGVELDEKKADEQLQKEIREFERMMANIGNVNLRALDTYDAAEKAYNELQEKRGVLVGEKESIVKLMDEIEGKKTELFLETFSAVNSEFQRIFGELSAKGEAFLELENSQKPFEAGMRIKVRLSGDKYLDIRSLSGGEKTMTALAFLFAIQEHEPASFYVLDEVDAALDKSNAEKLAQLIRKYCDRAQYIVISHNDNVILQGDILYGVSMDPKAGMSNVVSLKA